MFDFICCEDSPTKGLYDHCQSDDLDLHPRAHVCLKRDYFSTCNVSDNTQAITFKLAMTVDLWMPYKRMLVSMTLVRSKWVGKGKQISVAYSRQLSKQLYVSNLLQR